MIRALRGPACLALLLTALPAHAELTLCNHTSYLMDAAVALEKGAGVATRGWFRIEPGKCRQALDGALDADKIYVLGRTPPIYGSAPLPANGMAAFCVAEGDFNLANGRACAPQQQARFTPVTPSMSPAGATVNLAEEADYDDAQARLAGIQRLLVIAGYDATPIDGLSGAKTQAALAKFIKERALPGDAANDAKFFDTLLAAASNPQGSGFSWCNDTRYTVMAALGIVEMGQIVARGWYRIPAGQCLRPDMRGDPHRIYSYAEAVDAEGRGVRIGNLPLAWGGVVQLCTRDGKFELADHKDCATRGLNSTGFGAIDIGEKPATVVRLQDH